MAAEADAARAQRETEQAREIARLREEQAQLARDVHDVVGHSLAVILAQAESAQYLPDDDPEALKKTMARSRTSARSSLQDVRQVLSQPGTRRRRRHRLRSSSWSSGVRASGHEVRGRPRSARRSRCRRSSTSSPTGSCRRCSPTPSSTAAATGRSTSSGTGRRTPTTATCASRSATPTHRQSRRRRDPAAAGRPRRAPGQGLDGDAAPAGGGRRPARRTPP